MKIDAHNHIGKKKGISVSVDDFIKNMDEAGIDKAVVFSFSEQIDNEYVIESVTYISPATEGKIEITEADVGN